ncbi:MAG: hypothetical protein ABSH47_10130 [Bryobacteraceae bacterium]|jgi:hypothetical protein
MAITIFVGILSAADSASSSRNEIDQLRVLLAAQQKQMAAQQQQIDELRAAVEDQNKTIQKLSSAPGSVAQYPISARGSGARTLGDVASLSPVIPAAPAPLPSPQAPGNAVENKSPLSFKIGVADFTPVGFMDFTSVWRSTTSGGIGTGFGGIPIATTGSAPGNLSELRFSAQNSRFGVRVDSEVMGAKVRGYLEADFLGATAQNLFQESNSDTVRMRLYWVDIQKSKFELLAGQSWSLLVPNRTGVSPNPGDLFYTQDMDTNYQVGLTWTRAPGIRFVYHPTDHVAWAFAAEGAQQYAGGAVTCPTALAATYCGTILDTGSSSALGTPSTPNAAPDFISKLAFDGKRAHIEIAGILRTFRAYNVVDQTHHTTIGAGGAINSNFEIAKGLRLIENIYYSDGGGRYINGFGPDVIARANGDLSPVIAASTVDGIEFQANKNALLYGYYGGAYIDKNVALDTTGKYIGYGFPGSGTNNNRAIEEGTFGWVQTFWKHPTYGDLKLITQYSYLWRNPWNTPTSGPKDAHANMIYVDIRYDLP